MGRKAIGIQVLTLLPLAKTWQVILSLLIDLNSFLKCNWHRINCIYLKCTTHLNKIARYIKGTQLRLNFV